MEKTKENFKDAGLILFVPVSGIFYGLLNSGNQGTNSLITDIDRAIPLVKAFIVPYVAWYPLMFFTFAYLFFRDRKYQEQK